MREYLEYPPPAGAWTTPTSGVELDDIDLYLESPGLAAL